MITAKTVLKQHKKAMKELKTLVANNNPFVAVISDISKQLQTVYNLEYAIKIVRYFVAEVNYCDKWLASQTTKGTKFWSRFRALQNKFATFGYVLYFDTLILNDKKTKLYIRKADK